MKIVQYTNGGQMGCGVQIDDKVFYSGYDDTISLIRDGERGLEHAAAMAESADPVRFDRIVAPLKPGRSSAQESTTAVTATRKKTMSFPTRSFGTSSSCQAPSSDPMNLSFSRLRMMLLSAVPVVPHALANTGSQLIMRLNLVSLSRGKRKISVRKMRWSIFSDTQSLMTLEVGQYSFIIVKLTSERISTRSAQWVHASSHVTSSRTGRAFVFSHT